MHWSWMYFTFSWVGSILAVIFYEFGYKNAENIVEMKEGLDEDAEREREITEPLQPMEEAM